MTTSKTPPSAPPKTTPTAPNAKYLLLKEKPTSDKKKILSTTYPYRTKMKKKDY